MITPPPGRLGSRVGAYLIDSLVGTAIGLGAGLLAATGSLLSMLTGLAIAVGYVLWLLSWIGSAGLTPGKRMIGLRVVDVETGTPIGFGRAVLRQLVVGALGPVNLVQLFTIPASSRLQGWHDRAARSVVISTAAGTAAPVRAAGAAPLPPVARLTGPPLPTASAPAGMVPPPPGVVPAVSEVPPPAAPVAPATPAAPVAPATPAAPVAPATPAAPVAPATPATPPPDLPGAPAGDRTQIRPIPVAASATAPVLRTAAGAEKPIVGLLLLGRDPDVSQVPGSVAWRLSDPGLTVSKTHALVGTDADGAWIEDWHSTNGVVLRRGGVPREVPPHQRTPLEHGDAIELGDFLITLKDDNR